MIKRVLVGVLLLGVVACGVLAVTAPDDTADAAPESAPLATAAGSPATRLFSPSAAPRSASSRGAHWVRTATSSSTNTAAAASTTVSGEKNRRHRKETARTIPIRCPVRPRSRTGPADRAQARGEPRGHACGARPG